jgi:hypothetical protein
MTGVGYRPSGAILHAISVRKKEEKSHAIIERDLVLRLRADHKSHEEIGRLVGRPVRWVALTLKQCDRLSAMEIETLKALVKRRTAKAVLAQIAEITSGRDTLNGKSKTRGSSVNRRVNSAEGIDPRTMRSAAIG